MNSPFAEGRFEHDAKHLYYLPTTLFSNLERPKPTFLVGTRGSGKTTLLKALNWRERLTNPTLRRQLDDNVFEKLFIGTYVKLPKIQLSNFDVWLEGAEDTHHGQVVGFYLDLIYLQLVTRAVSDMLAEGELTISSSVEGEKIPEWISSYEELLPLTNSKPPKSVRSFYGVIAKSRILLEKAARTRRHLERVLEEFPIGQIGCLCADIAPQIAEFCGADLKGNEGKWHFKVCMDEGECLTTFQQKVINTQIRLSEWPMFPVVSYVGRPEDITTTLVPQLTHQKADRQLLSIDSLKPAEFLELAEGVASVRCQEDTGNVDLQFSANKTLGAMSINSLLQGILQRSEGALSDQLLNEANDFAKQMPSTPEQPPIWQAYLAKQLGLVNPETGQLDYSRYEQSREYRKKFVAAYLSICHDLRVRQIPYAGAEMVLEISDNCVRDFLSQLDHIHQRSKLPVLEFVDQEIGTKVQAESLRAASEEKRDSIPDAGVVAPVETGRVVKGLAVLTALIQSSSGDGSHLKSTEAGKFYFGANAQPDDIASAFAIITDAAEAGFLRLSDKGKNARYFRVHTSLAPAYGFSYRGAYYEVALNMSDFEKLKNAETEEDLERTARDIAKSIRRDEDLPLFPIPEGDVDD